MNNQSNNNLPKGWRKVKLGGIVEVFGGGTPSTSNSIYWNGNIPWLTPAEVVALNGNRFIEKTERYITEEGLKNSSAKVMPVNSLLLTSRATIGELVINKVPMATNQGFINIKPKNVDLFFLYYWLKKNKKYLNQLAVGSTFNELIKSVFKKIDILIPEDINEQKRIADILSAFDDKIELNNKINKTLEEMASAIFKEWFVKFRFPGWEKVKFVDSELGKIPEGWKVVEVKKIFKFQGGSQPPKSEHIYNQREGYIRFIQNRDYTTNSHLTYIPISKKNKICNELDILMDKYGEVGRVRWGIAGAYNVALAKIEPILPYSREFLRFYFTQESVRKVIESSAIASTRGSLNQNTFTGMMIVLPQENLLKMFQEIAESMLIKILQLKVENQKLASLRDLLLPKLMSGEIRV